MKEKMKEGAYEREYDTERGGKGRGGSDGGGGLYSCTLNHTHTAADYPFLTHTQFWGNILKDTEGEKRQN